MKRFLYWSMLAWMLGGCFYDVESVMYPEKQCTIPATVTFTADVLPLLNQYCNNCHAGTFASAGIRLDQYSYVKTSVDNGKLMGSIKWSAGYSPMPKNASKLTTCNLDKIQAWITAGALNN